MDWRGAIFGLLGAALVSLSALAFKSHRKWPAIRSAVSYGLVAAIGAFGFAGVGLLFARLFPEQITDMAATCAAVAAGATVSLVVVEFANWLRQP